MLDPTFIEPSESSSSISFWSANNLIAELSMFTFPSFSTFTEMVTVSPSTGSSGVDVISVITASG